MPELGVRLLAINEQVPWPEGLAERAGFVALASWAGLVKQVYGYETYRLAASEDGKPAGMLVLCRVTHPIFGDYLATAPFASYGGFAFDSIRARDALLAEARRLMNRLGASYVSVRFGDGGMPIPEGWLQQPIYSTYQLELPQNPETLMPQFGSDHRNHVRKSLKKGFSIRFGRLELLDETYDGLARSMHELGSPYHAKKYLKTMADSLGESLEFIVLKDASGRIAGAGVFILQGGTATNLHANILRKYRGDYAGEFLYWSAITHYCHRGFANFDMGRSLSGSGNETFKMKWRPARKPLAYWFALQPGAEPPSLNQKNPRFGPAIWAWKRLPSFVVRPLGPALIRGLA